MEFWPLRAMLHLHVGLLHVREKKNIYIYCELLLSSPPRAAFTLLFHLSPQELVLLVLPARTDCGKASQHGFSLLPLHAANRVDHGHLVDPERGAQRRHQPTGR